MIKALFSTILISLGISCTQKQNPPAPSETGNHAFKLASDSTIQFNPKNIGFSRIPATCGSATAPFSDSDLFEMFFNQGSTPFIDITFYRTIPTDTPLSPTLGTFEADGFSVDPSGHLTPTGFGQSAKYSPTGAQHVLNFNWHVGLDVTVPAAKTITQLTVQLSGLPQKEGDSTSITVKATFKDGSILDFTATPSVVSSLKPCTH